MGREGNPLACSAANFQVLSHPLFVLSSDSPLQWLLLEKSWGSKHQISSKTPNTSNFLALTPSLCSTAGIASGIAPSVLDQPLPWQMEPPAAASVLVSPHFPP